MIWLSKNIDEISVVEPKIFLQFWLHGALNPNCGSGSSYSYSYSSGFGPGPE
jgi:hypothetical protein